MAFGCLVAIDKAYNDRTKIERRKKLTQDVEQSRQEHSFINAQIQVNQFSLIQNLKELKLSHLQKVYESKKY